MPLETGSFINDLTPSNPPNSDPAGQGDDHLRLIKATVQGTFPQMGAIFGQARSQDTALSISSTWNTNHFVCSASATATVVLTLPPAASITVGYYVDITTIGTGTASLLPSGAASINGAASLSVPALNTARAYYLGSSVWRADVHPISPSAQLVGGSLSIAGTSTLSGTVVLSNGQLNFPAAQNPSANANTLDDYEEGTWTPVITYQTPGDLTIVYSVQVGVYTKVGRQVHARFDVETTTYNHNTASGSQRIIGWPFTAAAGGVRGAITGGVYYSGYNIGSNNSYVGNLSPSSSVMLFACFSTATPNAVVQLTTTAHTSGSNVILSANLSYET